MRLHIGICRSVVVAALLAVAHPAVADDSFFDDGRAQSALDKIFDKANHPAKILSLELSPLELAVELQDPAQPRHIDAWTDEIVLGAVKRLILGSESIAGPRPVDPSLPNPNLDANLFAFKPADAAIVPKLIAAAIKRAQLEDTATIARMELRRQLHLVPEPSSGAPEWSIEVTSGRERAEIYADLAGDITHVNLDGTRRAQALNYLDGGKELDDLVATVADVFGKDPTIKSIIVSDHSLSFDAPNPDHPDRDARFSAGLNGVYRDLLLDTVVNIAMPGQEPPGRFAITDIDWSLLPKLEQAARDRLQLPGGKIGLVKLTKPASGVGGPVLEWEINVKDAADSTVGGYVVFDVKGNVLNTHYPPGRGPKLDFLDAASYGPAFDGLSQGLGAHAPVTEIVFWPDKVMITAKDPKKPDDLVVFEYHGESLTRSIMTPMMWPTFGPDWFFDLSQIQPIGARWDQLKQDTLTRLGLTGGKIERITISKQKIFMPGNDRVTIEIRAEEGRRDGRVVYDLNGKMVDIVTP
jgi:hypothetical protein